MRTAIWRNLTAAVAARGVAAIAPERQAALAEPTGVSTFKAVESLGLKLDVRRTPIDIIVVDRIERTPTPN